MDHLFTPWRYAYVSKADSATSCIFCDRALAQRMEGVFRGLYRPDGINMGMNIGKAAGAGVAGHIHMHMLPRWVADANFMSTIGETRVLPESLEETARRIRKALEQ